MTRPLTIATRGSALALWQANHVRDRLQAKRPGAEVQLLIVKTQGDKILDVPLAKIGGKALFVKEIEQALLDDRADVAVHSIKDVPAELAPGLHSAAISEREDPFDALCTGTGGGLDALPRGAVVGTSSLRRQCQLLHRRPDLQIRMLRGNVPTRLAKLDAGEYDAVILAAAGLRRLGFADRINQLLDRELCLPAVGQGALGIETRVDDPATTDLCRETLHHAADSICVTAERAFLAELEGGCQTPLAAYALIDGDDLHIEGLIGRPDGTEIVRGEARGPVERAAVLGAELAIDLRGRGGAAILRELWAVLSYRRTSRSTG